VKRVLLVLGALVVLILVALVVGIAFGPTKVGFGSILSALVPGGDPATHLLVWDLRLPRAVAALLVGACLGAAGSLLQSSTRNPLGDPQLFGLGGGAAIIQALAMAGLLRLGAWGLPAVSVAASLVGAGAIAFFASSNSSSPARLALIGVSISALTAAVATGILAEARVFSSQSISFIGGSFANRGWQDVVPVLPFLAAGLILALPVLGSLNALNLGDRVAANLGVQPVRTRGLAIASSGILGGAAVAVAGLVGFVGLLVPHMSRYLVGHDIRLSFIVSIPLGALITLFADQVARLVFMPSEVPVGLITALVGAPCMIYLARRVA